MDILPLLVHTGLFESVNGDLTFSKQHGDFNKRSEVLAAATNILVKHFDKKLRREMYPVIQEWGDAPLAQLDRIAVPWFGVRGFGIHVNGFVRKKDGLHLWIGERATNRLNDPGKFDNMIGGGQPIGLSLENNLCKEAEEEAGIPADLALTAKPVTQLRYMLERKGGLRVDTLFIYDLELPEGYTPHNTDGEVAAFHLMPIAEVAAIVHDTNRFKFNCNLVVIDFLIRHGFLTAEHGEYEQLTGFLKNPSLKVRHPDENRDPAAPSIRIV
jgi:8-oxo-dGTP pyrophosphatase MutT (NUDIX family)